jgi:ABC-type transport system substrate-binding protein
VGELLPSDARILAGNSALRLMRVEIPGQPLQFIMNTRRFPTDSLVVRQALLYATNRNAIVDAIFQGFSPLPGDRFLL